MKSKRKLGILAVVIVIAMSSLFVYKYTIAPKLYDKYLNTGIKYLTDGQYEEAIIAFDKAIKIEAKSTEARVYQAKAYIGNEELDKAVEVLEEAQNIDKTNEDLLKEILDILKEIDSDSAYNFLDAFIKVVGKDNISQDIKEIYDLAYEDPSEPIASPIPDTYVNSISVKIKQEKLKVGHSYYYTLDGTNPNKNSQKYRGQIEITKNTTIKLIGYNKNDDSTDVITLEYIIDENILKKVKSNISDGEKLIKETTIGAEIGSISKSDSNKLKVILSKAQDVVKKDLVNYKEISNMNEKIEVAIDEFKNNIIKPVDKSKLKTAISDAQQLYSNASEGNSIGQYKSGSKSTLMNAINNAKKVYDNKSVKQDEVDVQVTNLNSAISNFKNNKVTQSERNADGSYTKEYVQKYYAKKFGVDGNDTTVSMLEGFDKVYNNELCYYLQYYRKSAHGGMGGAWEFYIGSKTLNQYDISDVGF